MMITHCLMAFALLTPTAADNPDIVFTDFEGAEYAPWKATGKAFGNSPARGTLPGQMAVSGFAGKGLVNSFVGGDLSTGKLTSPEFKVERRTITFLIGGGGFEGKTCINLVVKGRIVRSATGPNTAAGGSEALVPLGWNVEDLIGKTANLVIIDEATGGWGHINVDQIMFTDKNVNGFLTKPSREVTASKRYLHFPVKNAAKERRVSVCVDGKVVREFTIGLADSDADWWAPLDVAAWKGKRLVVQADTLPEDSQVLVNVSQDDTFKGTENVYREPLRPRLHFSPRRGWTNDPNGMVYANGEYHLYFQANPYGTQWGNMHWGHAVSTDLAHWRELPIALYPLRFGDMAFSGSAVVDKDNTSGWKNGDNELMVAAFTSTGRGECIVYSNDRGRTWTEFAGNPVVKHVGRDPRLLWYKPGKHWVMAVYDESDKKQWIAFYTSPDFKQWTYQSRIAEFFECPDLFELPLDGDESNRKWVLTAADSDYMVGTFDSKTFTPETPKLTGSPGRAFYAAQTFSDDPKGRVIQVGWMRAESPGMSFNQCMSLPLELRLVTTPEGPRLTHRPVDELSALGGKVHEVKRFSLDPGNPNPLNDVPGEVFRLDAESAPSMESTLVFDLRGVYVSYDTKRQKLSVDKLTVDVPLRHGRLALTVFADRTCFEVFANDGHAYIPVPVIPGAENRRLSVEVLGGVAEFSALRVLELGSIWAR